MTDEPLRIANCSGFYGDRFSAVQEQIEGGPIDVLTGDYLAELTMLILWKARQRDPATGYAATFLRQMKQSLAACVQRGIKVVVDAGGLNPAGLAARLREVATDAGVSCHVAHVEGDDILPDLPRLRAAGHTLAHLDTGALLPRSGDELVSANAYLGGFGIAAALEAGADIVVTGRVTDAAMVVGPAAWRFGWNRDAWDALAGAVVAGHVIECGPQCTGGNYAFFEEVSGLEYPGFPIAEMFPDGSSIITKHAGTGGLVSVGTVTAQLLYEIGGPAYANPDVTARFDSIRLDQVGPDRVRISGVLGVPPPPTVKVCGNFVGGWRNAMTVAITGLDIEAKSDLLERTLRRRLDGQVDELHVSVARTDHPDAATNETATAMFTAAVKDQRGERAGRAFSNVITETLLASVPGFYTLSPPGDAREYGIYWPFVVPAAEVPHHVVLQDGTTLTIESVPGATPRPAALPGLAPEPTPSNPSELVSPAPPDRGSTSPRPLGRIMGARSGDKGGNANLGVWVRSAEAYDWLAGFLTVERFQELLPETAPMAVHRYDLPNLWALNFVIVGLLGEGVASSLRMDTQAKSLGEWLRSRVVDIPTTLLT